MKLTKTKDTTEVHVHAIKKCLKITETFVTKNVGMFEIQISISGNVRPRL
jgi:hypothetical protein